MLLKILLKRESKSKSRSKNKGKGKSRGWFMVTAQHHPAEKWSKPLSHTTQAVRHSVARGMCVALRLITSALRQM